MIEHSHLSETDYAAGLGKLITQNNLEAAPPGTPTQWANESFRMAHRVWLHEGEAANEDYYRRNRDNLDGRLALAGFRLAILLNRALWE